MQQGLCESFVWEEFTSHGLRSVKREAPSFLDGSSSTEVRATSHGGRFADCSLIEMYLFV